MIVLPSAFHYHVAHVNLDISSNLIYKHFVHELLIRYARVLETEQHHLIVEEALTSDEQSFLLISLVKLDLVVTRTSIHRSE